MQFISIILNSYDFDCPSYVCMFCVPIHFFPVVIWPTFYANYTALSVNEVYSRETLSKFYNDFYILGKTSLLFTLQCVCHRLAREVSYTSQFQHHVLCGLPRAHSEAAVGPAHRTAGFLVIILHPQLMKQNHS